MTEGGAGIGTGDIKLRRGKRTTRQQNITNSTDGYKREIEKGQET